jgi:drug/metabolite transporter (DMT)-like permease
MAMRMRPVPAFDFAGMGVVVVVWGLNYLFVREGLTLAPPLWLAALRAGVGAAVLVPFFALRGRFAVLAWREVRDALAIGIPNTAMFFGLWFLAARYVPPGETAVLVYTFPLFVTLLSPLVLGVNRARWQVAAVVLGFGGVVLISQPWVGGVSALGPVPVAALLLAALSWAFGTVLFKRRFTGTAVQAANSVQLAGGAAALFGAALLFEGIAPPTPSLPLIETVAWLGLLGTAAAYAIWFALLDRTDARTLSAYTFLVPLVALGASALFFRERVDAVEAIGVALVIIALIANARVSRVKTGADRRERETSVPISEPPGR